MMALDGVRKKLVPSTNIEKTHMVSCSEDEQNGVFSGFPNRRWFAEGP